MGKYDESLFYSQRAFELNSKDGRHTYLIGEAYYNLKQLISAKHYYAKTLNLGHKTQIIETKINKIDDIVKKSLKTQDTSNKQDNANVPKSNDKNGQMKYFLSCINSGMSFCQLSFLIEKLHLSHSFFKD